MDMYSYCNSVMEPWDGPAALAMTDGRWVCAGLDRNGLRPMRYVVTGDGLVIAGSETGMVPTDEATVVEKGALGPGQMIAVDMEEGRSCSTTPRSRTSWPPRSPSGEWVGKITDLAEATRGVTGKARCSRVRSCAAARSRRLFHRGAGTDPRADGRGRQGTLASMGDDTPAAVLSSQYRPLSHFFRQNFSQVTNPPIDSLREYRVMSLKTRFGNLKNVLDEDSSQTEILVLDSPFVANAQFDEMVSHFGASVVEIDCTFPVDGAADALRDGLERIRAEAEDAVRSGAGHIILTDQGQDESQRCRCR
jgi:glutamate synthase (NADPH/NADH) large chain